MTEPSPIFHLAQAAASAGPRPSSATPMQRVLLTGTYNSRNKGDAAMELVALAELGDAGHDVIVATPEPEIDAELYGADRIVAASRRRPPRAALNLVRAAIRRMTGRWILGADDELRATADADVVVDLSGDMLTEDYGVRVALSHFHPILLAWLLGTPYVALAQSIGPFHTTTPLARFLLRRAALVTAREEATLEHIGGFGVDITVTADSAFLLRPEPVLAPTTATLRIGVSLSDLGATHHRNGAGRSLVDDVATALKSIDATHDVEWIGIPHVTGPTPDKDDRRVLRELQSAGLDIEVLGDLRPGQLKGALATCDVVIGARMHANIGALGSGVPVVALGYSHKFRGIMAMFELDRFVLDLGQFDAGSLEVTVRKAIDEADHTRAQIERILPTVVANAEANFELLDSLVLRRSAEMGSR